MVKGWDRIETMRGVRECCVGIQDGSCWTGVDEMLCLAADCETGVVCAGRKWPWADNSAEQWLTGLYCPQH